MYNTPHKSLLYILAAASHMLPSYHTIRTFLEPLNRFSNDSKIEFDSVLKELIEEETSSVLNELNTRCLL